MTIVYKGVGYRMPNNKPILEALNILGKHIYASSANITGEITAQNIEEAKKYFKNTENVIYIDQKTTETKNASTVFDYDNKKILRKGDISKESIWKYLEL